MDKGNNKEQKRQFQQTNKFHTGLSNIHKYRLVNQTALIGVIPFTSDSGSLPKDHPNGSH
jgi:hypothetical protein